MTHDRLTTSRRQFLSSSAGAATGALAARAMPSLAGPHGAALRADVLETRVISLDAQHYHGWPTVARARDGRLLVACSGGRDEHVCPFGRVDLFVSNDGGQTWSWPRTILDSDIDDRDAGILETAHGTLLVTTFTSLAYEPVLATAEQKGGWDAAKLRRWQAAHNRVGAELRQAELGQWIIRSTDGGCTWSPPAPSLVNSPHGPIQLRDGRLLYAGKELWTGQRRTGVCESHDDGRSWQWLAEIPVRAGDSAAQYHELHAVECASGRLIVHVRNHNDANRGETLQCESGDGGKTWTAPHPIGVWGLPSHLLRLQGGRVLMTYGYRRDPFGNQARVSDDEGRSWSEPLVVSADGSSVDLGYPSTVELPDGTLLSVWYEALKDSPLAVLRQAKWRLVAAS